MAIKVKNINGTGKNARQISGSWIEYWEQETNRSAKKCFAYDEDASKDKSSVYRCKNTDNLVGGHVMKADSTDDKWYILPICSSHNHLDKVFWAKEDDLVLASK